ncbi:ATP-binding protein [Chlorobium sp. BLA1]|uniref:ATP-binding protein n=1 Tax=Candidatus Chlorobium masyuteum TaxID=2716876 RepID=UPI001423B046|nr:ATP-binding protein [Candidatus Chlorobium masyuteum]NHQ60347.1 ATP-binding protein [Candidatus Chlorobium masyuteum]NTU44081.1 ATP-binding protein [Chlorobiaceae bacterium]
MPVYRHEIVLTGRDSQYSALHDFIASFAASKGYSAQFSDDLQLSLKEAFINAVKHGNLERDELSVSCSLRTEGDMLLATIKDCGEGFNPEELPDPLDPHNRFQLSGRGVYIIKSIAESINLERSRDGSTLMLRYIPY